MKKKHLKSIKAAFTLVVALLSFAFLQYLSIDKGSEVAMKDQPPPENLNRKPSSDISKLKVPSPPSPTQEHKLPELLRNHVPSRSPASTKGRWSQRISSEDDKYISTQLTFDNKPVENYYYRWKKDSSGQAGELIAGILPEVKSVSESSLNEEQKAKMIDNLFKVESAEMLSIKEVWNLNSDRILSSQFKIEVQAKSRSERSAGHEYWFVSLSNGRIVKRVEADRY